MRTKVLFLPVLLLTLAAAGSAQVPAVSSFVNGTSFTTIDSTAMTVGWTFTANSNLVVSALGFWELDTSVPLDYSHQVGLWTYPGGSLITSALVLTTSPATGNWRYAAITPVTLTAGQMYVIGSSVPNGNPPNPDFYRRIPMPAASNLTSSPLITVGSSAISNSAAGFSFPGNLEPLYAARFGPNLIVTAPPSITKAFGATSIAFDATTTLTFTIQNTNPTTVFSGLAFTDTLPAGLVVASTPNLTNTCGGTPTATAGASSVSLSGGTLATSASCTLAVNVTGTTAGNKTNTVSASSTEGGTSNSASANITVQPASAPAISKAFGAASIALNGSTSLSFTIQNGNTAATLNGIGFSDTFPSGLAITTPSGLTGSCGGGSITATPGTNVVSLSGASLAAGASCTFSVNVTGTVVGTATNTTGTISATESGAGTTATAILKVNGPPSVPISSGTLLLIALALAATAGLQFRRMRTSRATR